MSMESGKYILCIFLLLWLQHLELHAQSLCFRQYTSEQGLPSTEVYDVIQDKEGYIWVATDRGVARFDGYSFEAFTTASGLSNNVVFKIQEGPDGKIWFGEMSGTLSYYERGRIYPARENPALLQLFRHRSYPASMVIRKNYMDVGYIGYGIFRLQNGTIRELTATDTADHIVTVQNGEVLFCSKNYHQRRSLMINHAGKHFFDVPKSLYNIHLMAMRRSNGDLIVAVGPRILVLKKNGVIEQFSSDQRISFFETPDSCLYVVSDKGFCRYAAHEDFVPDKRYRHLSACKVTKVIMDREGGLWVTTLDNGVFYCAHPGFTLYDFKSGFQENSNRVHSICGNNKGTVFAGLQNGSVYTINQDKECVRLFAPQHHAVNSAISYDTLNDCLLTFFKSPVHAAKHTEQQVVNLPLVGIRSTVPYQQGYLSGNDICLAQLRREPGTSRWGVVRRIEKEPHINCMLRLTDDSIFIGTSDGLYQFKDWRFIPVLDHTPYAQERINAILCLDRRELVLATISRGLLFYDLNTGKLRAVTSKDGLSSDAINDIAAGKEGTLWLAGNKGLSRLTKDASGKYSIRNYTLYDGLPFTDIKRVHAGGHIVYIATNNGLILFDTEKQMIDHDPEIRLGSVYINEQKVLPEKLAQLDFNQNNLRISFLSVIPKMLGNVRYRYRLQSDDNDRYWTYVQEPQLLLSSVEPGSYRLLIQACNNAGQWSKAPLVLPIRILAPFWRRGWFIACSMLVITGAAAFLQRIKLRRLRENARNGQLMMDYQQQALINQINPHFLFNSMNSIQKYILREDKEQAVSFVSKFAKLMRLGLEQSREPFIPLTGELELLQIYLLLEEQRFGKKVAYRLELQHGLEERQLMIPPMLIQPFMENAIRHGILHKPGHGTVILRLYMKEQLLYCEVEDDGVGRQKAMEIKQQQERVYHPLAININTARLQLLARSLNSPYFFEVIDQKDQLGAPAGTLVTLILPFKYES